MDSNRTNICVTSPPAVARIAVFPYQTREFVHSRGKTSFVMDQNLQFRDKRRSSTLLALTEYIKADRIQTKPFPR